MKKINIKKVKVYPLNTVLLNGMLPKYRHCMKNIGMIFKSVVSPRVLCLNLGIHWLFNALKVAIAKASLKLGTEDHKTHFINYLVYVSGAVAIASLQCGRTAIVITEEVQDPWAKLVEFLSKHLDLVEEH